MDVGKNKYPWKLCHQQLFCVKSYHFDEGKRCAVGIILHQISAQRVNLVLEIGSSKVEQMETSKEYEGEDSVS